MRWAGKGELQVHPNPRWWTTGLLPAPLRHSSGRQDSHTFITHELASAILAGRKPAPAA